MLAALSHDLRTPLTLLRLRIEALCARVRSAIEMLASIAELNAMIDATLLFARDEARRQPSARQTDLAALLTAIVARHGGRRIAGDDDAGRGSRHRMPA